MRASVGVVLRGSVGVVWLVTMDVVLRGSVGEFSLESGKKQQRQLIHIIKHMH